MYTKERIEEAFADLKELYKYLYSLEVNGKYTDAILIVLDLVDTTREKR